MLPMVRKPGWKVELQWSQVTSPSSFGPLRPSWRSKAGWKVELEGAQVTSPSFWVPYVPLGGKKLGGKWNWRWLRSLPVCARFFKVFGASGVTFGVTESHPRGSPSFSAHPPKTCSKSPGNETTGWKVDFGWRLQVTPKNHPDAPPGGLLQVFEGF